MTLTLSDIQELRRLSKEATERPWRRDNADEWTVDHETRGSSRDAMRRENEIMSEILSWAPRPPSEAYEGGNDIVTALFAELDELRSARQALASPAGEGRTDDTLSDEETGQ